MTLPGHVLGIVSNITSPASASLTCDDMHNCRSLSGIIYNCISTIFLCTWIALRPPVPSPDAGFWGRNRGRVLLMVRALFTPEFMLLHAFEEWTYCCSKLVSITAMNPDCGWTEMHVMLLHMGGFQVAGEERKLAVADILGNPDSTNSRNSRVSSPPPRYNTITEEFFGSELDNTSITEDDTIAADSIRDRRRRDHISITRDDSPKLDLASITEDDIRDRSKTDYLSCTITILQTLWFAGQVAARVNQGLAVTELEFTTLGHVALNIFVYWCWWKKPLNISRPIVVCYKQAETVDKLAGTPVGSDIECHARKLQHLSPRTRMGAYSCAAVRLFASFDRRLPPGSIWRGLLIYAFVSVIAGTFGAVHCLAWNSTFPTHIEQNIWRALALVVMCTPLLYVAFMGTLQVLVSLRFKNFLDMGAMALPILRVTMFIHWTLMIIYGIGRACLLILALIAFRKLPYTAFVTPSWSTYLPHIG